MFPPHLKYLNMTNACSVFITFLIFCPQTTVESTLESTQEPLTPQAATAITNDDNENDTLSEEDLDGPCESKGLKAIAKAIQRIGMQLLENLEPTEDQPNVIISPLSISLALSQLALGKACSSEAFTCSHLALMKCGSYRTYS